MIDRAIGLVGLGLALITVALQYYLKTIPTWALVIGFTCGIMLIGISVGLISAGGLRQKKTLAKTARLKLHVYGDHRTPEHISSDNIFRWYLLWTKIDGINPDGGISRIASVDTLFASFETDVVISTLRVSSPNSSLPSYEVKEFNQRYAIVVFSGSIPGCTLELSASL